MKLLAHQTVLLGEIRKRVLLFRSGFSDGSDANRCPKLVQSLTLMSLTDVRFLIH
jgi:hypothetical protein